jgi:anti-anti-sigma regulatory factor
MKALQLKSSFGPDLRFRVSVKRLVQQIELNLSNDSALELDFKGIDFISRAFADELVKAVDTLKKKTGKSIIFSNPSFSVIQVLEAVQKTQTHRMVTESKITNYQFDSVEAMKDFMYSW